MSETKGDNEPTITARAAAAVPQPVPETDALPELMAAHDEHKGQAPVKGAVKGTAKASATASPATARDLEAEALRAAEAAIADGELALARAQAAMRSQAASPQRTVSPPKGRGREFVLGALLSINVLAMLVIALLPSPERGVPTTAPAQPAAHTPAPTTAEPRFNEPWNQALAAAERADFKQAVAILDGYLASSPRMAASQQLSVLMALAHYSARTDNFKQAQEYQRRADAIEQSHSLPEDLVLMAKAAVESGDQESLRRVWARFLLQQRQIPSWLYKHVAEAYLQLGDSYRLQANAAAEQAQLEQLQQGAARLRDQTKGAGEGGK